MKEALNYEAVAAQKGNIYLIGLCHLFLIVTMFVYGYGIVIQYFWKDMIERNLFVSFHATLCVELLRVSRGVVFSALAMGCASAVCSRNKSTLVLSLAATAASLCLVTFFARLRI
jgi:hypothetical protein